jgi:CDP-diacylglycerol--glycerol-3-phosphate 3-phosphatidyltransferase
MLSQWKTPANIVTMVRIVLVVVFIVMTVMAGPSGYYNVPLRWASAVLFIIAASTDKIDGYLARSRGEVTDLGKLLDPIADKLLICSALVILSVFNELFWWVTILFLIREIGITLLRFFVIDKLNLVIAASQSGKLKTVLETVAISMFMVPMWVFDPQGTVWTNYYYIAAFVVMILALEMCLWSGGEYLYNVYQQFKSAKAESATATATEEVSQASEPEATSADSAHVVSSDSESSSGVDDMLSTLTNEVKKSDEAHAADQMVTGSPFGADSGTSSGSAPHSGDDEPSQGPIESGRRDD